MNKKIKFIFLLLLAFLLSFNVFANSEKSDNLEKFSKYKNEKDYQFYKKIETEKAGKYYIEIDNDMKKGMTGSNSWKNNIVLLGENSENSVPYRVKIKKDSTKCISEDIEIEKEVKVVSKNKIELLIDFKNSEKALRKVYLLKSKNNRFSAAYEVFGSHLKNSGYEKINVENPWGVLDLRTEKYSSFIEWRKKYRYVKVKLTLDEGSFGNIFLSVPEKKCNTFEVEKKNIDFKILEKEFKKDIRGNTTTIIDTKFSNQFLDFMVLTLKEKTRDPSRYISIYGANSENAKEYEANTRYKKGEEYWKKISGSNISFSRTDEEIIKLYNSKYRFYKIVVNNNDKRILDYDIKILAEREFIYFIKEENGSEIRIYYDTENRANDRNIDLRYNEYSFKDDEMTSYQEVNVSEENENKIFKKKLQITKTESKVFTYIIIFLLIIFLGSYLWKVFKDVENENDVMDKIKNREK